MFLGAPFAVAPGFDACAVDQQVQGPPAGAAGDLNRQVLLPPRQRAVIGHRPIQPRQLQKACHQPGRLPQLQAEQRPQCQAGLDRCIREHGLASALTRRFRLPLRLRVKPYPQRTPLSQRHDVSAPVRRAVSRSDEFAHTPSLTDWIRGGNPVRSVQQSRSESKAQVSKGNVERVPRLHGTLCYLCNSQLGNVRTFARLAKLKCVSRPFRSQWRRHCSKEREAESCSISIV